MGNIPRTIVLQIIVCSGKAKVPVILQKVSASIKLIVEFIVPVQFVSRRYFCIVLYFYVEDATERQRRPRISSTYRILNWFTSLLLQTKLRNCHSEVK